MAGREPRQSNAPDMNASFVTTSLVGVAISLPLMATAATALRLYVRSMKTEGRTRADDWAILITLTFCWAHSVNTLVAGGIGGINTITMAPEEYANIALRALWISSLFLITSLYTVKVSILLFYYHLFSINLWFKRAVLITIGVVTLWWISSIILAFVSTDRIDAHWKNAALTKHRFNFRTWFVCYAGLSILFDVVILCFPIPMIKSLRVNTKQKISILGIFWLGGFVCISAIVRFVYLYNQTYRITNYGENQYSSITVAFIWAEIEPNMSIIAACLPVYGPLFKEGMFFPRLARSLSALLGHSIKTRTRTRTTATNNASMDGYYELDKTINSKPNGDLVSDTTTKKSAIQAHKMEDVEP